MSEEPAKDWYRFTWISCLLFVLGIPLYCCLKQQVQVRDPEEAEGRSRRRAAERRKRRSELLENAIKDKMLKIDELGGDNWRNIFFRWGGAGWKPRKRLSNRCWASQKWNWRWEWASLDPEQTTVWTLELRQWIQNLRSKSKLVQQHKQMNLNTYSRRQSSSLLQKRVRFYTGLPGFDVPFC